MHRSYRNEQILDAILLGSLLVGGSFLARRAADETWRLVSDEPPPDPDDPSQDIWEVAIWSLVSGVLVGLTRLLVRRKYARLRPRPSRVQRLAQRLR